jgi:hypothetical protein
VIRRRRLPPALVRHAAPRLALAGVIFALALVGIVGSVIGAREDERFHRRAVVTTATVVEGGDDLHVAVQLEVDGTPTVALAPVADREPYEVGEPVEVRYDPDRPAQPSGQLPAQPSGQLRPAQPSGQLRPAQPSGQSRPARVELVEQPYDLATPMAFFAGLALIAIIAGAVVVWRAVRLVRLAGSTATSFAFAGRLRHQDRTVRREQTWVLLAALDSPAGAPPVASVPLLPGQTLPESAPFQALVKGDVRDGGTAVVLAEDQVLWPSGRVRVGDGPTA